MDDAIRTEKLCKQFGKTTVLDQVSIHIPTGAIYGLVGNNGAGKTTLMRILLNLQHPTSGRVEKKGRLKIGAVIEAPALYPTLSARGNLKYQKSILGDRETDIQELLALVHLPDNRKPVLHYSLGMKQRLALALALVGNPDLLLLDEPLNGLDPEGIRDMRAILQTLQERYHKTILVSSHLLHELQKIATQYGFLKQGRLIREVDAREMSDTDLETFYFQNFS